MIATLWSRLAAYQTLLLAAVLIVVLAALVLPPFVFLLKASVVDAQRGGEWSLANFEAVLGSRRFLAISANSLVFAAGSAVVALAIGWTTAWIVERTNTPLKPLAYLTAIISLGTPYILYVTAWLLLFGKAGPVNQLYRTLTGTSDVLIDVYSMPGMIMVEGFLWSPLAFLLVGATLRNANPELEEAARVSGAGTWMTIRRVTLRLSLPSILALAMLVFIRAIEAFEVPALVGLPGRISVLTTDIYGNMVAKAPPDIGGASALSVLMLALVLVLLAIYGRLSRHAERFATITGKGFRPRPFDLGRLRYLRRRGFSCSISCCSWPCRSRCSPGFRCSRSISPSARRRWPGHSRQLSHRILGRSCRADRQHAAGRGGDRNAGGGAHLPGGMAGGAAGAGRLGARATGHHPAGLSRPHSRHRGDAALSASADPAVRHAGNPDLGVRHQLPAVWNALQRRRHAADPSRARRVGGDVRRLSLRCGCAVSLHPCLRRRCSRDGCSFS